MGSGGPDLRWIARGFGGRILKHRIERREDAPASGEERGQRVAVGEVAQATLDGCLGGLATDGYAWEPIRADNPLLPLARDPSRNVILTPHVAAGDMSASREVRVRDYTNVMRVLRGTGRI